MIFVVTFKKCIEVDLRHNRKETKSPQHEPSMPFCSRPFPLTQTSTTGQKKAIIPQADSGWTSWAVAQAFLMVLHFKQMKLRRKMHIIYIAVSYITIGTKTHANYILATITAREFSVGPFALLSRWLNDFPLKNCLRSPKHLIILQEDYFEKYLRHFLYTRFLLKFNFFWKSWKRKKYSGSVDFQRDG